MTTFTEEDRISAQKERMKDISEHIIVAKRLINEMEQLITTVSSVDAEQLFKKSIALHEATAQVLIEADRIGNFHVG